VRSEIPTLFGLAWRILDIRSDGIHAALADDSFILRLQAAYEEASGWGAEPTQLFEWAVQSLPFGKDAVVRRASADGRTARREIEAIARREVLPDTIDQMLRLIEYPQKDEDPEPQLKVWASVLGASHRCTACGTSCRANWAGGGLTRWRRPGDHGFGKGCGHGLGRLYGSVVRSLIGLPLCRRFLRSKEA